MGPRGNDNASLSGDEAVANETGEEIEQKVFPFVELDEVLGRAELLSVARRRKPRGNISDAHVGAFALPPEGAGRNEVGMNRHGQGGRARGLQGPIAKRTDRGT